MATVRLPNLWEGTYRIGDLIFENGVAQIDGDVSERDRRLLALIGGEVDSGSSESSAPEQAPVETPDAGPDTDVAGKHAADVAPDQPMSGDTIVTASDAPAQAPEPQPVTTDDGTVGAAPSVPSSDDAQPAGDTPTPADGTSDSGTAPTV